MKCPTCANAKLVMSERQGVEIDYCPECRGIWLDRGELDKILERVRAAETTAVAPPAYVPHPPPMGGHAPSYGHGHGHKPYRKKSFIEDLFD